MNQQDFGFEAMAPYVRGLERLLGLVKDHVQAQHEAWVERESIEAVFGLGGGELDDEPWEPWQASDASESDLAWSEQTGIQPALSHRWTFHYHYDGVPDWAGRSAFPDLHDSGVEYCTVVRDCMFGDPPKVLHDRGSTWHRRAVYRSSGETECTGGDGGGESIVGAEKWRDDWTAAKPPPDPDRCPLCEEARGEAHGYIYIGDGWCEVVYRARTLYCDECGTQVDADAVVGVESDLPDEYLCHDCKPTQEDDETDDA